MGTGPGPCPASSFLASVDSELLCVISAKVTIGKENEAEAVSPFTTWPWQFHSVIFISVASLPRFKGKGYRPDLSMGECQRS